MNRATTSALERRIVAAAEAALAGSRSVSMIDVLTRLGWLPGRRVDEWRQGRIADLEEALSVRADKLATALRTLHEWAERQGLTPSETAYVAAARDRRPLRFTSDGDEVV